MNSEKNTADTPANQSPHKGDYAHIAAAYSKIHGEILECTLDSGRPANAVTLLAVSKTRTVDEMAAAYRAGARHFGENYLQDALPMLRWFKEHRT